MRSAAHANELRPSDGLGPQNWRGKRDGATAKQQASSMLLPPAQAAACATKLLGGGFFAEAAHAFLELLAQRPGSVGIKGHEIPERLGAIAAQA